MKWGVALSPEKTNFGPLLFSGDVYRGVERAGEVGFDGVELSIRDAETLDKKSISEKVQDCGVKIFAIATGQTFVTDGFSLFGEKKSYKERAVDRMKRNIEFASSFDAAVILGGILGKLSVDETVSERQREEGLKSIATVADYAEEHGVTILLEAINRYESNIINNASIGKEYIDELNRNNIKLLLDTFHMNIEEKSIIGSLVEYRNYIGYIHFADSNRLAPGMGHTCFSEIISVLQKTGYNGVVTAEILPSPDDDEAIEKMGSFMKYHKEMFD